MCPIVMSVELCMLHGLVLNLVLEIVSSTKLKGLGILNYYG
jgi:hypothetical protein